MGWMVCVASAVRCLRCRADSVARSLFFRISQVIPRQVLANAKGFCILTVVKAGFLFSARGGSGIVIAKLPDGGTLDHVSYRGQ